MIDGIDGVTIPRLFDRVIEGETRSVQTDANQFTVQPPLQRFALIIKREPDARRAAVDREKLAAYVHGFAACGPLNLIRPVEPLE